jgi:TRAP-type C4-dicarboxylate transport system substrate-binding protein
MDTWKEVSSELKKDMNNKEQNNVSLLESKGMTFSEPGIEAFREATKDVWKKLLSEPEEIEAYQKIKAIR